VTLVVLGAFFYTPPTPAPISTALAAIPESPSGGFFERKFRAIKSGQAFGNPEYPGENRTVLVAVLARMIITPLLLLPVIAVLAKYDLFEAAEDPVFILAAVLLVSSVSYAFRVSANATGLLDATQELMSSHLH
jgi:hypothetical protein